MALAITLGVVISLLFIYFIAMIFIFVAFMRRTLWCRGTDPEHRLYLTYEDYKETIERRKYECIYNLKKEKVRGYIYKKRGLMEFKGFVILAHGLYGTHVQYLLDMNMLCENGYIVLAFDQVGCGLSDGKNQVSFPMGARTLERVISDVEERGVNDGLPIILYGHSWGAFSVCLALRKHPEIKKAVMRNGFISPTKAGLHAFNYVSKALYFLMVPVVYPISFFLLGRKDMISASKGFKNNSTKKLVIHAKDDPMVSYSNSIYRYCEKKNIQNTELFLTKIGGHNSLLTQDGALKYKELNEKYKEIEKEYRGEEKSLQEQRLIDSLDKKSIYTIEKEVKDRIISFLEED